ncbi:MAG: hypothetical protein ACXWR1_16430 [Bdellovibrionota bacterium]
MLKFLTAFLLAAPAFAAPGRPAAPAAADPAAQLITLDQDLRDARVASPAKRIAALEDFREDLLVSSAGHEVEMEKIPAAPEDTAAPAQQ